MDNQNRLKINVETPTDSVPPQAPPRPRPAAPAQPAYGRPAATSYGRPVSTPASRPATSYGRPVAGAPSYASRRNTPTSFDTPPPVPSQDDLNSAFVGKRPQAATTKGAKKAKKPLTKARKFSIAAFVVGILVLIGGVAFCAWRYLKGSPVADARFLVEVGAWQMQGEDSVVWKFTDIGKGTLTTNNHINDYDFIWAMDGDELKIDTNWLYTMNDEFTYQLDQSTKELKLTSGEDTYIFVPLQG